MSSLPTICRIRPAHYSTLDNIRHRREVVWLPSLVVRRREVVWLLNLAVHPIDSSRYLQTNEGLL